MFNMLCITFICVAIIDLSGFIDHLKGWISYAVFKRHFYDWDLPLFGCSFCTSWWANLAYLIITGTVTLPLLAYSLLLSIMTPVLFEFITMIKNLLLKIINYADKRGN